MTSQGRPGGGKRKLFPQARLADVVARIAAHKVADLAALLLWHWAAEKARRTLAA
jgi:hypothetical protein